MTFEEHVKRYLTSNGFFDFQADEIIASVKAETVMESMAARWNDDTEGYSPQMLAVVNVTVNRCAVKWIDENSPKAWFRPMFAGQ